MTALLPPRVEADRVARAALASLSASFDTRDLDSLVEQFSSDPASTYTGSEAGEIASGRSELVELLSALLARPERYRFEFDEVRAQASGSTIWVLADGHGYQCDPHGGQERFPYRVVGVLGAEPDGWRWLLLSGSEPTTPDEDACLV
jgi:SnoaL-like domain